jgi:branched-subunit amino acid transport protein
VSLYGIVIGFFSFIAIGLFHPLVIYGEYHFGVKIWPLFLIAGIILCIVSLFTKNILLSTLLGVTAFCSFWSIKELFHQQKRVERGWFPKKPGKDKSTN